MKCGNDRDRRRPERPSLPMPAGPHLTPVLAVHCRERRAREIQIGYVVLLSMI